MKRFAAVLLSSLASATLVAAQNAGFGLDAFNRTVSAATPGSAVFSPFAFEIDSVIFSEAVDPLSRAKVAETMGVLNGLEYVYRPLYEEYANSKDGALAFLDARGFCLREERKAHPAYRQWMQRTFLAESFSARNRTGAEIWFRERMDGAMEDFSLPVDLAADGFYSYYDLACLRFRWKEPFPTNDTREIKFQVDAENSTVLPAMCDLRSADIWVRKTHTALRLPISDDFVFFALLPNPDVRVRDVRFELNSSTFNDFICGFKSVTELGISHGPAAVVIPRMDITSESDLKLPFEYFRFATRGVERLVKDVRPRYLRQIVKFRLDERGFGDKFVGEKSADRVVGATPDTKRIVLNRPFVFFVYHEPTATIPVVGQFTGR